MCGDRRGSVDRRASALAQLAWTLHNICRGWGRTIDTPPHHI